MPKHIQSGELSVYESGSRRRAVELECPICSEKFLKSKSKVKPNTTHFCSRKCWYISNTNRIRTKCGSCGVELNVKPSQLKRSKSGLVFCSRRCKDRAQRVEHSIISVGHYVSGIRNYRRKALNHYGSYCSNCNYSDFEGILEVHHIDNNRKNNDLDNLIVLCPNCHSLVTRGIFNIIRRKLTPVV